ncbi:unnamed protein product, partial [Candidula unifasciata]
TDILRKQIENNEMNYDFSHVTGLANHQPYRSKSLNTNSRYNHEGPDSNAASSLAALQGDGHNRMANDYSHNQLLNVMTDGPGGPGTDQMQALNVNQHSRSPSLKVRRYSFLAGSRRGRGFSEVFDSTILNDHFDQYTANENNAGCDGLGTNVNSLTNSSSNPHSNTNHNPFARQPPANPSPDSGVSESMDDDSSKMRSLQRRRTMPCILDTSDSTKETHLPTAKQLLVEHETAHSSDNLTTKVPETFLIENGIRKRIQAEVHLQSGKEHGQFPTEYKFVDDHKLPGGSGVDKRGSLPDLKTMKSVKPLSRREAYQLSSARREEIRRLQDLAERRRQGDMSVILGDVR